MMSPTALMMTSVDSAGVEAPMAGSTALELAALISAESAEAGDASKKTRSRGIERAFIVCSCPKGESTDFCMAIKVQVIYGVFTPLAAVKFDPLVSEEKIDRQSNA